MVIQHNLAASNANRNLGVVSTNLSKDAEKLSSGYQINRGADNAAGLAISEKMRGQIRGLNRASDNAEDAISLLQTAQGGMQETHNLLQRMRELCVQAANDTNTTDDRSQIKVELDELSKEIDRIANTTEFNGMKLINGDHSLKAQDVKTRVQEYLKGSWIPNAMDRIKDATGWSLHGNITMNIVFGSAGSGAVASMSGSYGGNDFKLTIDEGLLSNLTLEDFQTSSGPEIGGILFDRVITHELTHAVEMQNMMAAGPRWFMEGLAEAVQGHDRFASQTPAAAAANASGGDAYKMGYLAVSYLKHNGSFDVFLDSLKTTSFGDALKTYYGFDSESAFTSYIQSYGTAGAEGLLTSSKININDQQADALDDWDGLAKDVNPSGGGVISIECNEEYIQIGEASCQMKWKDLNYERNGFRFQVNANAGQEIEFNMGCLRSKELYGAEDIDVSTHSAAAASITRFDGAIRTVSSYRSRLDATQNRLEHTIWYLDNAEYNLQGSESKIRDTDYAKQMVGYSKNKILTQTGQSVLAQANQTSQSVASLLQG